MFPNTIKRNEQTYHIIDEGLSYGDLKEMLMAQSNIYALVNESLEPDQTLLTTRSGQIYQIYL
ncbi:hypothetical protein [Evansella clarkii]|uniref:hypothetical protein n=1 Tax=Evansella clarkii TaxID=79879 RepID=UPI0009968068|nr:hypothetical protein [Evansella clarkii]